MSGTERSWTTERGDEMLIEADNHGLKVTAWFDGQWLIGYGDPGADHFVRLTWSDLDAMRRLVLLRAETSAA